VAIFPENGPSVPGFPSLGSVPSTWGSPGERDLLTLLFRLARALFDKLLHVAHAEANRPGQLDASERRAPPAGSVIPYPVLGHSEQLRRDSGAGLSEVFGTYPPLPDRR
jgi:hypothetical protein